MATALQALTAAQFEEQYGQQKPHYEFWYGEAVQKSMPNSIHGLTQAIITDLLRQVGYKAGTEIKLNIEADFQPVPDIIAARSSVQTPYPTTALEIVVEILSQDDPMARLLSKCRAYQRWGFREIYVVDPDVRLVFRWLRHRLQEVSDLAGLSASQIWTSLDSDI